MILNIVQMFYFCNTTLVMGAQEPDLCRSLSHPRAFTWRRKTNFVPPNLWVRLSLLQVITLPGGHCVNSITQVDKTRLWDKIHSARNPAEVAELADALRSGRSEGSLMWVQVPPSAQRKRLADQRVFCYKALPPLSETEAPFQILDLSPQSYINLHALLSGSCKFTEKSSLPGQDKPL